MLRVPKFLCPSRRENWMTQPQIERRIQLYNQAEQIAIDKVAWLPLFYPKLNILIRPRVEGIVVTPQGLIIPDWSKVKLQ